MICYFQFHLIDIDEVNIHVFREPLVLMKTLTPLSKLQLHTIAAPKVSMYNAMVNLLWVIIIDRE